MSSASAVVSWLVAFNVINSRNDVVRTIWNFLYQVTEPVLRPIRNILPNLGGIDVSPSTSECTSVSSTRTASGSRSANTSAPATRYWSPRRPRR